MHVEIREDSTLSDADEANAIAGILHQEYRVVKCIQHQINANANTNTNTKACTKSNANMNTYKCQHEAFVIKKRTWMTTGKDMVDK